jgi:nucleoside-diphosphate-sugar epimerase
MAGETKVLLTGAAGRIARAFIERAGDRYDLRLADREAGEVDGREVLALDVADLDAFRRACEGMDVVVHLAADPSPEAGFYDSLLENNVKGTYNAFRAARDAGCRRVVYASSIHAVDGYPPGETVMPDWSVRPPDLYGAAKCFGEALAYYFSHSEGLSCLALRIGAFEGNPGMEDPTEQILRSFVSERDMSQLIERCIEAEVGFGIFHAISDNREKRLDISSAREVLGYEPEDDAFELYGGAPGGGRSA